MKTNQIKTNQNSNLFYWKKSRNFKLNIFSWFRKKMCYKLTLSIKNNNSSEMTIRSPDRRPSWKTIISHIVRIITDNISNETLHVPAYHRQGRTTGEQEKEGPQVTGMRVCVKVGRNIRSVCINQPPWLNKHQPLRFDM